MGSPCPFLIEKKVLRIQNYFIVFKEIIDMLHFTNIFWLHCGRKVGEEQDKGLGKGTWRTEQGQWGWRGVNRLRSCVEVRRRQAWLGGAAQWASVGSDPGSASYSNLILPHLSVLSCGVGIIIVRPHGLLWKIKKLIRKALRRVLGIWLSVSKILTIIIKCDSSTPATTQLFSLCLSARKRKDL